MHLVIDNYDSFTYNIVQYLGMLGADVEVRRNDAIGLREIDALDPQSIVISPGPCTPREAGISTDVIRRFAGRVPILGVCLGHQCIADAFGGRVRRATVVHGKFSRIRHRDPDLFRGIPQGIRVARYHSLVVDDLPDCFEVTAEVDDEGQAPEIMAIRHREHAVVGVQFHPESVLTDHGLRMLENFMAIAAAPMAAAPAF